MSYLADSDFLILLINRDPRATALFETIERDGIAVSVISLIEVLDGAYQRVPRQPLREVDRFLEQFPLLELSGAIGRQCAKLRAELRDGGFRVSSRALDLIIAATAIHHDLTLVTRNIDDYRDIPGLKLYGADLDTETIQPSV